LAPALTLQFAAAMTIRRLAYFLPISLAVACAPAEDSGPKGPGGKADDLAAHCDEPDANCLDFESYEVLFTNPECERYDYQQPMELQSGEFADHKPRNVYCKREDAEVSAARSSSPQFRLLDWITALEDGDEIFLSYLSFSNRVVGAELCEAAERGVDVTFVLDKFSDRAAELQDCGGEILIRGHQGSVGFQHVKLIMINPDEPGPSDKSDSHLRMSFGSGNMSSGTVLHHENWHFLDVARDSYFVESHRCLRDALVDSASTDGKGAFRSAINNCRDQITQVEEDDIQAYFIPVLDDAKALTSRLVEAIESAGSVDIAAHRFSYTTMIDALTERLESDPEFSVRLVADDDLYWLQPLTGQGEEVGPNLFAEAGKVDDLAEAGGDRFGVKYMQTHHGLHLLHHNKWLHFKDRPDFADELVVGSSNLTGTGFKDNLENMYWIQIPEVAAAFAQQYARFYDGESLPGEPEPPAATAAEDMPVENVTP